MTEAQFVIRVREMALERGITLDPGDIRDSLDPALHAVSRRIAESGEYALQQKEATLTLTSGVASLATETDLLIDTIDTVLHPSIDGVPRYLSRIPDGTRADLTNASGSMYPLYVIEKGAIYCSLGNGGWPDADDLPDDTAELKATGSQVATLANLNSQYEDDLILQGVSYAAAAQAAT